MTKKLIQSLKTLKRVEKMKLDDLRQELHQLYQTQQDLLAQAQVLKNQELKELTVSVDLSSSVTRPAFLQELKQHQERLDVVLGHIEEKIEDVSEKIKKTVHEKKRFDHVLDKTKKVLEDEEKRVEQKGLDEVAGVLNQRLTRL